MKPHLKRLDEQVIVITGASSGIGRTTARMAADRGASVVLAARDAEDLREAANEIRATGGDATDVVCDVRDMEAVRRLASAAVERYGRIDTWFNNAGVSVYGRTLHVPVDDARELFETNYWGVVHGSLVAVEHLRARGGALINMGSVGSDRAIPLQGHYSASKHAIRAFTDALRMELEKDGVPIVVTLIKPAAIDTPYPHHARAYTDREPKSPPPVYAPGAVARAVLHCAANPARDVTVGGAGRVLTAMAGLAPRLTDRYMEATMFDQQLRDEEPITAARRHDALDAPRPGDAAERGDQPGYVLRSSAYTEARLHPMAAAAAGIAGAAALAGARRWLRR